MEKQKGVTKNITNLKKLSSRFKKSVKWKKIAIKMEWTKGQLISECLIGSIVSNKKPTKFF